MRVSSNGPKAAPLARKDSWQLSLPAAEYPTFLWITPQTFSAKSEHTMIEDGKQVSIELTLALDDGTTAIDKQPLAYQHGKGKLLLPALERALAGLEVGDVKSVTLSPEDGYGTVDPEAFGAVKADGLPEDARKVGTLLTTEDKKVVRVHEVHDGMLVLDLNHPLAGQNLHFDVHIVAIEQA